jgi:hypothetical protein
LGITPRYLKANIPCYVEKTVAALKGEITMSNKEKFESFKQKILEEN